LLQAPTTLDDLVIGRAIIDVRPDAALAGPNRRQLGAMADFSALAEQTAARAGAGLRGTFIFLDAPTTPIAHAIAWAAIISCDLDAAPAPITLGAARAILGLCLFDAPTTSITHAVARAAIIFYDLDTAPAPIALGATWAIVGFCFLDAPAAPIAHAVARAAIVLHGPISDAVCLRERTAHWTCAGTADVDSI
jgi:hypothetical protein